MLVSDPSLNEPVNFDPIAASLERASEPRERSEVRAEGETANKRFYELFTNSRIEFRNSLTPSLLTGCGTQSSRGVLTGVWI